jgi:predicted nucleotide-binding protein (sugar kinase/HSP70/actin superfamily)
MKEYLLKGVILAGRPYHIDPEIPHGIPELITGLGYAVFTKDSVSYLGKLERPLRIIDQWSYHNRLLKAAQFSSTQSNLEYV